MLKDMRITKKEREKMAEVVPTSPEKEGPMYPYGLSLSLADDALKKLPGLNGVQVGDTVKIIAEATVTSVSERERQGSEKNRNVELQIEKLDCECEGDYEDAFDEASKGEDDED